jgi:hypothetical protein
MLNVPEPARVSVPVTVMLGNDPDGYAAGVKVRFPAEPVQPGLLRLREAHVVPVPIVILPEFQVDGAAGM